MPQTHILALDTTVFKEQLPHAAPEAAELELLHTVACCALKNLVSVGVERALQLLVAGTEYWLFEAAGEGCCFLVFGSDDDARAGYSSFTRSLCALLTEAAARSSQHTRALLKYLPTALADAVLLSSKSVRHAARFNSSSKSATHPHGAGDHVILARQLTSLAVVCPTMLSILAPLQPLSPVVFSLAMRSHFWVLDVSSSLPSLGRRTYRKVVVGSRQHLNGRARGDGELTLSGIQPGPVLPSLTPTKSKRRKKVSETASRSSSPQVSAAAQGEASSFKSATSLALPSKEDAATRPVSNASSHTEAMTRSAPVSANLSVLLPGSISTGSCQVGIPVEPLAPDCFCCETLFCDGDDICMPALPVTPRVRCYDDRVANFVGLSGDITFSSDALSSGGVNNIPVILDYRQCDQLTADLVSFTRRPDSLDERWSRQDEDATEYRETIY